MIRFEKMLMKLHFGFSALKPCRDCKEYRRSENGLPTFAYDANNNLVAITDANGNQTLYEYDALGRRTKETLPDG